MKKIRYERLKLAKIVGGGQAMGELEDGKKVFVWGGLPGEDVTVQITRSKSSYAEGVVTEVFEPVAAERVEPVDPSSYLSTSPWQIMSFEAEQQTKADLIAEAFEMHKVSLPSVPTLYTDGRELGYRNKVEFSWWWDNDNAQLDLAFFRRGTRGKIPVNGTSLAMPQINKLALAIRNLLRVKRVEARNLKTLLIRANADGACVWQLYVKDKIGDAITEAEATALPNALGGEIIYSDPKSPASRITERLSQFGDVVLCDELLGKQFSYACEGFFQVNLPVYERSLKDMREWAAEPVVDMYSGVGSIGLTIGGAQPTLVEIDEHAHREMLANIKAQKSGAVAVLAPSEKALQHITPKVTVIVDPPRAGLHQDVVNKLLEQKPARIIYLSCNPVTQARDVALLSQAYEIKHHQGYNYFPRTPHIENLVILQAT